jgi:hypothetical protein
MTKQSITLKPLSLISGSSQPQRKEDLGVNMKDPHEEGLSCDNRIVPADALN